MAGSPSLKIYRGKEYVASCKYYEDAAAIAALSPGTIVKYQHKYIIWTEGAESEDAANSYDVAARIMRERVDAIWAKAEA